MRRERISWIARITHKLDRDVDNPDSSKAYAVAVDPHSEQIYWNTLKEVWRANIDGSRPELVVFGKNGGGSIDVDSQRGYVYFGDTKDGSPSASIEPYSLIRRLKFPALPVRETTPAPADRCFHRSAAPTRRC